MAPVTRVGPKGVTIASSGVGRWESTGERDCHFRVVQVLSNHAGDYLGTLTIDGHLTVSEDGLTVIDNSPESQGVIRDPVGKVVSTINDRRDKNPVKSIRIGLEAGNLPFEMLASGVPEAIPANFDCNGAC